MICLCQRGEGIIFIEFTLSALLDIILLQEKHQVEHQVELSCVQIEIIESIKNKMLSRKEIFIAIGMANDSRAFKRHIEPLLDAGLVEMTIPDKPNSKLQKYRLKQ